MSQTAYEGWHDALEVDSADAPWHQLLKVELAAAGLAGKRILEIGCGRGGFACWMASQNPRPAEVVATDFSQTAVDKGRDFATQKGITGITWATGDIQAIAHPDNSFDIVISCETIEHVPDPAKAVKELGRVLKKDGLLLLTTPNYFNTTGLYRLYLPLVGRKFTEGGQPINNFMLLPRTRAMVKAAGCRIEKTDGIVHSLPVPGRPPIRFTFLDHARFLTRWTGLHSMIVAKKN
jgi:2-polyprenyl-3-methyl-5-hydroxy-6-metoxy-1,4-benzoquinol methylase